MALRLLSIGEFCIYIIASEKLWFMGVFWTRSQFIRDKYFWDLILLKMLEEQKMLNINNLQALKHFETNIMQKHRTLDKPWTLCVIFLDTVTKPIIWGPTYILDKLLKRKNHWILFNGWFLIAYGASHFYPLRVLWYVQFESRYIAMGIGIRFLWRLPSKAASFEVN